jgi:hypothetical protein
VDRLKGKHIVESSSSLEIREMPSTLVSVIPTSPIVTTLGSPNQALPLVPALETISEEMEYSIDPLKKQFTYKIAELHESLKESE